MADTDPVTALHLQSLFSNPHALTLFHYTSRTLPAPLLTACFNLISHTSSAAYAASSRGWHPAAKLKEMREAAMQYLLVSKMASAMTAEDLEGFLSYQLVDEDGVGPVIYIYEIHVASPGKGVGTSLMQCVDAIGRREGKRKAMLTVFVSNQAAIRFYERCGYEKWDEEYIPPRKRLRSGDKEERKPTYIIMAKNLIEADHAQKEDEEEAGWETDDEDET